MPEDMPMHDESSEKGYSIDIPDGFEPPDGLEPGQPFDATVRVRMDENGKLCIDSINGIKTHAGGESPPEEQGEQPEDQGGDASADEGDMGEEGAAEQQGMQAPPKMPEKDAMTALDTAIRKKRNSRKSYR